MDQRPCFLYWAEVYMKYDMSFIPGYMINWVSICHSHTNILRKSTGNNLLSNALCTMLFVQACIFDFPLISKSLGINGYASQRQKSTILYSQCAPEFYSVTATLEYHLGQCQSCRHWYGERKDAVTSTQNVRAITQHQIKIQSHRQPR